MEVTIKRNTGWIGMVSKMLIKLNGEKIVRIAHNQELNFNIQDDSAYLKVHQFGSKSNKFIADPKVFLLGIVRLYQNRSNKLLQSFI